MFRLPPLQFILALSTCVVCSESSYRLTVGPKPGETGRYIYKVNRTEYRHCVYCPEVAFQDTENNIKYQEEKCIANYPDRIKDGLSDREKTEKKYPLCKVGGEVPVCESPPDVEMRNGEHWYCDPGYSNTTYSVYFSCAVICGPTGNITKSFYCNESLEWEEETGANFQTCTDNGDGTVANKTRVSNEFSSDHDLLYTERPREDLLSDKNYSALLICVIVLASVFVLAIVITVVCVCLKVRRPIGIEIRSSSPEVKVLIESPTQSGNEGFEGSAKGSESEYDNLTGRPKADSDDRSDSTNVTIETDTNTDSDESELSECIDSTLNRTMYCDNDINCGKENKHEEFIEGHVDTESHGDHLKSYGDKTDSYGGDTKNYGENNHQKTTICCSSKTCGSDKREDVTTERQNGRNSQTFTNKVEETTDDVLLSGSRLAPLGEESPVQPSIISHHTSYQTSCYSSSHGLPSHTASVPQVNTESVSTRQDIRSFSCHNPTERGMRCHSGRTVYPSECENCDSGNHRLAELPGECNTGQFRGIQSTFKVPQQRPDPTGHATFSMIHESGYFDDENDDKHNTELKHVVNTGTGERGSQTFLPLRNEPEMSLLERNTLRDCISRRQLQLMSPGEGSRELIVNYASDSFEIQPNELFWETTKPDHT